MSTATQAVLPAHLKADCTACVGLCCVVSPFDAVQGFGFDKPAHTPCPHLCADFRCGIHETLEARGFRGCVVFDCQGAGQRVTRHYSGRNWRDDPELAQAMYEAYTVMRGLHETMALLYTASVHVADARIAAMLEAIEALCERGADRAEAERVRREALALLAEPGVRESLRGLRPFDRAQGRQAQPER